MVDEGMEGRGIKLRESGIWMAGQFPYLYWRLDVSARLERKTTIL